MANNIELVIPILIVLLCIDSAASLHRRPPFPYCQDSTETCYPQGWKTRIDYYYKSTTNTLMVNFEEAPQESKFTKYLVTLSGPHTHDQVITAKGRTSFFDVCNGQYEIHVKPIDPYLYEYKRCLCYDKYERCQHCATSKLKITIDQADSNCVPGTNNTSWSD